MASRVTVDVGKLRPAATRSNSSSSSGLSRICSVLLSPRPRLTVVASVIAASRLVSIPSASSARSAREVFVRFLLYGHDVSVHPNPHRTAPTAKCGPSPSRSWPSGSPWSPSRGGRRSPGELTLASPTGNPAAPGIAASTHSVPPPAPAPLPPPRPTNLRRVGDRHIHAEPCPDPVRHRWTARSEPNWELSKEFSQ
jgi:hypothetical protein